mgnify:CR=1 FL=1
MINIDEFNARLGNNAAIVGKILKVFCDQYGHKTDLLRDPVGSGDTEQVYFVAHSIKGALANICAEDDANIAAQIESAAKAGTMPEEALIVEMESRMQKIYEQIDDYLN